MNAYNSDSPTTEASTVPITRSRTRRVTLSSLMLAALVALPAGATPVQFGFYGIVTHVQGFPGQLPGVAVGTPFAGTLMYDPAVAPTEDSDPRPDIGGYYFNAPGSFELTAQFGGHTVSTVPPPGGGNFAGISIYDGYDNNDWMSAGASSASLVLDGARYPTDAEGSLSINFSDPTSTAFASDALPTTILDLAKFGNLAELNFRYAPEGGIDQWLTGTITLITPDPQYLLFLRRNGANVVLSWPLTATGFALETQDLAVGGPWQPVATAVVDTAAEHTVTLPIDLAASRVFRLKRP